MVKVRVFYMLLLAERWVCAVYKQHNTSPGKMLYQLTNNDFYGVISDILLLRLAGGVILLN